MRTIARLVRYSDGAAPEAHADVQCIIQRWIDSSISKTVNAPKGYSVEQVEQVYERFIMVEQKVERYTLMVAVISSSYVKSRR